MRIDRTGLLSLLSRATVTAAALLSGVAAANADVITPDPTLPPEAGAYVGTNGGAGCFASFGVCAEPGVFAGFKPISSAFDAAGQELVFDATFTTTVTNLSGTPLGTISFTGEFDETVLGRTATEETGSWKTQITDLDLDGTLTGPLAGVSGGIGLDPSETSTGETSITPVAGGFRIDSFFDAFVELTLNTSPPVIIERGPQRLALVSEPGALALLALPLVSILAALAARRPS
jgi:hypothetical protein